MSENPDRIPLADAVEVARFLISVWFPGEKASPMGSVRRGEPNVGDIDILTLYPIGCQVEKPIAKDDPAFQRIAATMRGEQQIQPALFGEQPARHARILGEAVEGLKPGFKACKLLIDGPRGMKIKVQIFRTTAENAGWAAIKNTGPADFGKLFLIRWKERYGIPMGDSDNHPASRGGSLLDSYGIPVPTAGEMEAFEKCGMTYIPPKNRRAFAESELRKVGGR